MDESKSPEPSDVPDARPAALDRLQVLVGAWEMEATFEAGFFGPDTAAVTARGGRTTFEWLDGEFFLIERSAAEDPSIPRAIMIIGLGEDAETFVQHYYDSRGVERVYEMTLEDGVWSLLRIFPGFSQRYRGVISEDGDRIDGAWEKSADGSAWEHDFSLSYLRVSTASS
jgi:hypothetical protein